MTDQSGRDNTARTASSRSFGALLRAYRRECELRQEELAERAGISVYTISNLERGVAQSPHKDTVELLARALGLSAADEAAFLTAARHSSALQRRARAHPVALSQARPLPLPLTPLIGRERELGELVAQLQRPDARLVTLVGLGGVGKTRHALAAAHTLASKTWQVPAAVTWVSLARLRDPALVLGAIAEAVGARETPTRPLAASLRDMLTDPPRLLALDNFEHLLSAAPGLTALLEDCPQLRLLVTSRAPLSVRGEQVVDVRPLPTPAVLPGPRPTHARRAQRSPDSSGGDDAHEDDARRRSLLANPSVALFLSSARARRSDLEVDAPTLEHIAAICRRLDGLPLAIELAAATARELTPKEVLVRLDHLLDVLGGSLCDLPERQQSLRAALRWSYELLPPPSQILFRQLGVCVGGCPLTAAQELLVKRVTITTDGACEDADAPVAMRDDAADDHAVWEALEPLLAHQLVWRELAGGTAGDGGGDPESPELDRRTARISLLETVCAFATERLRAAGEEAAARAAHARSFLHLAEAAATDLKGTRQADALALLDQERANLYAALQWCEETGEANMGLRLAGALGLYWEVRHLISEGRVWFERILAIAETPSAALGASSKDPKDPPAASESAESTVSAWRALRARAVNGAGSLAMWQGDYPAASARLEEALTIRRELGDERAIAASLNNLGGLALLQGDFRRSRALWEETLALRQRLGDPRGVALAQLNCGIIAHRQGRSRHAHAWLVAAEAAFHALGDEAMRALALAGLGEALRQRGDAAGATAALDEGLTVGRSAGRVNAIILALSRLAELARLQGQIDEGRKRCEEALSLAEEHEELREVVHILLVDAGVWLEGGELDRATTSVDDAQTLCDVLRFQLGWAEVALWRGRLAIEREDWMEARSQLATSLALRHDLGTVAGAPECLEGSAYALVAPGGSAECAVCEADVASRLLAIATHARDSVPALRSPREERQHKWTVERMQGPVVAPGVTIPTQLATASRRDETTQDLLAAALRDTEGDIITLLSV
jgi:predicted ATPase/DNA-binding XRE family transcriptional regulator